MWASFRPLISCCRDSFLYVSLRPQPNSLCGELVFCPTFYLNLHPYCLSLCPLRNISRKMLFLCSYGFGSRLSRYRRNLDGLPASEWPRQWSPDHSVSNSPTRDWSVIAGHPHFPPASRILKKTFEKIYHVVKLGKGNDGLDVGAIDLVFGFFVVFFTPFSQI